MNVLEMKKINYSYENSKQRILNEVNMSFESGVFYAIIGNSGAGKSTLLSLLAGLDSPNSGQILFEGNDITTCGYDYHRKHQISLVFQNYNLIDYLTPLENLKLVNPKVSPEILLKLGLEESQIHRNVMKLSGGQQQRVAIARALVSSAPVLLADEPTGNLDEQTASEIIELLKEIAHKEKKCVIVVTHSRQLAKEADVLLKLEQKKLNIINAGL